MIRHGVGPFPFLSNSLLLAYAEPVLFNRRIAARTNTVPRAILQIIRWGLGGCLFFICAISSAKVIGVTPGVTATALTTWHILNCSTPLPAGNYAISIAPKYGSVTFGSTDAPPVGCPPTGPSLPAIVAFYTMNVTNPPVESDYFQLHYVLNGSVLATYDIYVFNSDLIGKVLGGKNTPNKQLLAEPIDVASGNVFYSVTDSTTAGQNPLTFTRYYNSLGSVATQIPLPETTPLLRSTLAESLGTNWRSNYDRYLKITSGTTVIAERPDGQQLNFTLKGSTWTSDTDIDMTLTQSGNQWVLTDSNDTVETYTTATLAAGISVESLYAQLDSIRLRNGYTQTLHYSGSTLNSVTDPYNRSLSFTYSNNLLQTVTTPDGLTLTYGYDSTRTLLTSVSYSTTPQTKQTYLYENTALPDALTGIVDENGARYATWAYDAMQRGASSQLGAGVNATTIVYDSDSSHIVTNALGVQDTYKLTTLLGLAKVTEIDRAATSTTTAANETFTYDANGYLASQTDWNGNQTTFENDSHGLPTTVNEAVGTSAARTTTITYDSTWVHLPSNIVTTGLTTSFTYDSQGEVLTRTLRDTTSSTAPYSTNGQARTWMNTWSNSLLASVKSPNGNVTKFGYDSTGALISITDPLNHVTQITSHTGGGLPETIVDPNNVTTTLAYDPRQRLTSSTVRGGTGTYKTTFTYDAAGNLTKTTLPDNSSFTNLYDAAHRLTETSDADGNFIQYMLDALGDRTQTLVAAGQAPQFWQSSGTFDALGRELVETGGAGQATTRAYDANGNALTVTDGLNHTTTNAYDALNRLNSSTDANSGITTPAYDAHDRIVSVTDANGNTTSYVRDGFGDVIQQTSPDSGTTIFHFDGDANLTSKTDALGIVTNQTFDALDRPLTTTYPSDTSENVTYTYDQTGSAFAFGIGRLTSVTDAAGSLTRIYEERGNLVTEKRVNGKTTLTTGYTYDGAGRISLMSYPDGTLVGYQRDPAGFVTTVLAQLSGASTVTTIATLNRLPLGPVYNLVFGNNIQQRRYYDASYRPTTIGVTDANLQVLNYTYDNANNIVSIKDSLNAANSQTFSYDAVNRLLGAVSSAGGYGSYSWTYDKVGNRLTQVLNSVTTSYGYTKGTNRLATITTGTPTALLKVPARQKAGSGIRPATQAHLFPNGSSTPAAPEPHRTESPTRSMLAVVFGWPMLALGFAGIVSFRRRLLGNVWLILLIASVLSTGGTTLLLGCGSSPKPPPTPPTAATPTFSPATGTYTAPQTVTISDSTAGATIYFTTDGTVPTAGSTKYTTPISVSSTETLKAIAEESGYTNSAVATATYTINIAPPPSPAATPTFSPAPGTYTSAQMITISDATAGAAIYFTTDGTTPTINSPQYTEPIPVGSTETIKAIATASGYTTSPVATATYTITLPTAAAPTFTPPAGTYTSAQNVTLSDSTAGVSIYYTADGTDPTTGSTPYIAAIDVSSTETIKAIATASGFTTSPIASATYTINSLTGSGITVITNANGNITSIPPDNGTKNATFTYNAANRLASATGTPEIAASYVYDYAGKRFSKTHPSSTPIVYIYAQDGSLIAENNSGMQTDYVYVDGMPIAVLQPSATPAANQVNYIVSDHLGTPQTVVNSSGNVVWSTTYAPFGDGGSPVSSIVQNLRMPGQSYDIETGFYQNGARDYMPKFGRYLETDMLGLLGGINTYVYVENNFVKSIDPDGQLLRNGYGNILFYPFAPFGFLFPMQQGQHFSEGVVGFVFADDGYPIPAIKNIGNDSGFDTNCHGFTFAQGELFIPPSQVPAILSNDRYTQVDDPSDVRDGDAAVYYDSQNVAVHSGIVISTNPLIVEAKDGPGGFSSNPAFSPGGNYNGSRVVFYRHK